MPIITWASPIWWNSTPGVLQTLEIPYNRMARWITGLPVSTRTTKLLICSNLPPLRIWLDLLSHNYAIHILSTPNTHNTKPLPPYNPNRTRVTGPNRVMSYVADILTDVIEDRSNSNTINIPSISLHRNKPSNERERKKLKEIHMLWEKNLPPETILIFTDGSRSEDGYVGAGWVIQKKEHDGMFRITKEGYCHLGHKMEVYDAELHAIFEALSDHNLTTYINLSENPQQIIICIDNQAAIAALADNPTNTKGAYMATHALHSLKTTATTAWVPSHCGIPGNETADRLAKKGSERTDACPHAYTSIAWMRRRAREKFLNDWKTELGLPSTSWKTPPFWNDALFEDSRLAFRVYCGRTDLDPLKWGNPTPCRCGAEAVSSKHIVEECPLFDKLRDKIRGTAITPPNITVEMAIDPDWYEPLLRFIKDSGIGSRSEPLWPKNERVICAESTDLQEGGDGSENESEDLDFEVGEFE